MFEGAPFAPHHPNASPFRRFVMPPDPAIIREHLTAIEALCDPLPPTAEEAYARLVLIEEIVEVALHDLGYDDLI